MTNPDLARHHFKSGANCAQAVILTYSDLCGITPEHALKLGASLGGGMGRLREVCGAVSGMFVVLGLLYGYTDLQDKAAKDAHYALIQHAAALFKAQTGSIVCRELLGLAPRQVDPSTSEARTDAYYKKRPCVEMVALAATILDTLIAERS